MRPLEGQPWQLGTFERVIRSMLPNSAMLQLQMPWQCFAERYRNFVS